MRSPVDHYRRIAALCARCNRDPESCFAAVSQACEIAEAWHLEHPGQTAMDDRLLAIEPRAQPWHAKLAAALAACLRCRIVIHRRPMVHHVTGRRGPPADNIAAYGHASDVATLQLLYRASAKAMNRWTSEQCGDDARGEAAAAYRSSLVSLLRSRLLKEERLRAVKYRAEKRSLQPLAEALQRTLDYTARRQGELMDKVSSNSRAGAALGDLDQVRDGPRGK